MVKISSSSRNQKQLKGHVKYISRSGLIELKNERGDSFLGEHAVTDAIYTWQGIPKDGERRETFNIIWSMPAGTPRREVTQAVENLLPELFADHQYLYATHTDTDKPHLHTVIMATPIRGTKRLNPRKADLQHWREMFAEKLRGQGIECNATPRAVRGARRGKTQATLRKPVTSKKPTQRQLQGLRKQRKGVVSEYGEVVRELQQTGSRDDKELAAQTTAFVQEKLTGIDTEKSPEQGRDIER